MNHAQVLDSIAEFVEFGECVVIKQTDWNSLVDWVNKLPKDAIANRPNFDILPVIFNKDA